VGIEFYQFDADERRLVEQMMLMWSTFGKTGSPSSASAEGALYGGGKSRAGIGGGEGRRADQPGGQQVAWTPFDARNFSGGDVTMLLDTPALKLAVAYKAEDCYFWSRV
jgi:hypothetical protein